MSAHNILFLSPHNGSRSLMAEAILNQLGGDHYQAFSAGDHPAGGPDHYGMTLLELLGTPVSGLHCKHWSEFAAPDSPALDCVVVLGSEPVARGIRWPGDPPVIRWPMDDPAAEAGTLERASAFRFVYQLLGRRIDQLIQARRVAAD